MTPTIMADRVEVIAEGITLYLGDCREILPTLPKVDAVVTDPPYGINWRRGENKKRNFWARGGIQNDKDTSVRDDVLALLNMPAIVFGSFYAPFPQKLKQVLVWHKGADSGLVGATTGFRRDAEPIFLIGGWPVRAVKRSSVFRTLNGQGALCAQTGHPHTKPLNLMMELVEYAPAGTILDPFMGSGTTGVAAIQLGRKFTGIEIEPIYFDIACRRISEALKQPDMLLEKKCMTTQP